MKNGRIVRQNYMIKLKTNSKQQRLIICLGKEWIQYLSQLERNSKKPVTKTSTKILNKLIPTFTKIPNHQAIDYTDYIIKPISVKIL